LAAVWVLYAAEAPDAPPDFLVDFGLPQTELRLADLPTLRNWDARDADCLRRALSEVRTAVEVRPTHVKRDKRREREKDGVRARASER
jgi:hypothetical protein